MGSNRSQSKTSDARTINREACFALAAGADCGGAPRAKYRHRPPRSLVTGFTLATCRRNTRPFGARAELRPVPERAEPARLGGRDRSLRSQLDVRQAHRAVRSPNDGGLEGLRGAWSIAGRW